MNPREHILERLRTIKPALQQEFPLFVLMGTLQYSADPKALANAVKHFAFTRCGELNVFGMVDAQIAVVEEDLFTDDTVQC